MMADNTSSSRGGIGFFGLLTIVLITLKLTHVISWSWWWVTCPIWLLGIAVTVFVALAGLVLILADRADRADR